eukprot:484544_1
MGQSNSRLDIEDDSATVYDSINERGACYSCIRILWCGCREADHVITESNIHNVVWEDGKRVTISTKLESVSNAEQKQGCCCCFASCCCGCCIHDFGDITISGFDQARNKELHIVLQNVANSTKVTNAILDSVTAENKKFDQTI